MKQTLFLLLMVLSLPSCNIVEAVNAPEIEGYNAKFSEFAKAQPIPNCIKKKIKDFKKDFKDCRECFIEQAVFKGQTVYIFDEGSAFDAPVSVYNGNCELLGSWGGRRFSAFRQEFETNATNRIRLWH